MITRTEVVLIVFECMYRVVTLGIAFSTALFFLFCQMQSMACAKTLVILDRRDRVIPSKT